MIIKHNLKGLEEGMREFANKQLPFIMSRSFNDALFPTRQQVQKVMANPSGRSVIKGGATGFTKSRLRYKKSHKNDLHVALYFTEDASYMKELMYGGTRRAKNSDKVIKEPASGDYGNLNKFGNFGKAYTDKLFALARAGMATREQRSLGYSVGKLKKRKGGSIVFGESKGGTYGIWDWGQISTKTGNRPKLLMYLGRKERDQKPTAIKLPDISRNIFETRVRKVMPRYIQKSMEDSFKYKMRKFF